MSRHAGELFLAEVNGSEELIRVLNKVHQGSLGVVSILVLSTVNLPLEILGRAWKNFPHSDKDTSVGAASWGSEG